MEKESQEEKLNRADLLRLYEQYATEIRTSVDFAHRNLSFYVGLLSAILAAALAGLLGVHPGDARAFALLIGPCLVVVLAEAGYSTVAAFYHRFMDAYFALVNIQHMLRLDDLRWVSGDVAEPYIRSRLGGFISQWADPIDWLKQNRGLTVEAVKQAAALEGQLVQYRDILKNLFGKSPVFQAGTLSDARRTMWAFELASLLLVPAIFATGLS